MAMKPIIKWSGGKKDEIKMFQDYIPEYDTYIEPFIGGGGLYFHLAPKKAVIADIHDDLIAFYKCIKDGKSPEIYEFMKENPNEQKTYYRIRDEIRYLYLYLNHPAHLLLCILFLDYCEDCVNHQFDTILQKNF